MHTIGEISKIVNISVDTLRYYDEIGLLKPVRVDKTSKYRYYSDFQIEEILLIMELKHYGFSLEEIKSIYNCKDSNYIKEAFQTKFNELEIEVSKIQSVMKVLSRRIKELNGESDNMLHSKTVLIVDDVFLVRMLIKNILIKFGYSVIGEAENGIEACEKYFELKPDLVIMDSILPRLSGVDAIKKIKEKDSNTKILMCSEMSQLNNIIEALNAGALDFICKPFSEVRLIEAIENILENKCNYDFEYLTYILNQIMDNKESILDNQKFLSQKEIDELLAFLRKKMDISNAEMLRNSTTKRECNYIEDNNQVIRVDAGRDILQGLADIFQEFVTNSPLYFKNTSSRNYSIKLLCVEQTLSSETLTLANSDASIGIINFEGKTLPASITSLQEVTEGFTKDIFNFIYHSLKPILKINTSFSLISRNEFFEKLDSTFNLVNVLIEISCPNNTKFLININFPHEIAKTEEFRDSILGR